VLPSELTAFDFELPSVQIAQRPCAQREAARLLVLDRARDTLEHAQVADLPRWLAAGDLMVTNATRVVRARLLGRKTTGGSAEALLLEERAAGRWRALVRCGGRLRPGLRLAFGPKARAEAGAGAKCIEAEVVDVASDGIATLVFPIAVSPYDWGELPLPPYIRAGRAQAEDHERYQTIYARVPGSVAAPTAGLHLGPGLLAALSEAGVNRCELVLHIGPGTFRPPRTEELACGRLHPERFELPAETAAAVNCSRSAGHRVLAVGTTTTRVLESCADPTGRVTPQSGTTDLFLRPGSHFRAVDALLTNFHLPRSSLLMLVAAFAGRERVLAAYREAIARGYRFYSYGDAMLIL